MPLGVGSSFQVGDPYPIYLREGRGAHVWDVDGHEYVDTHGGFGSMVVGHAHPKIVEAIERAIRTGSHFAAPDRRHACCSPRSCAGASTSSRCASRNSGTEATMSAIRIARAATGRDDIVKIEGSYHGHHDAVMFSVVPERRPHGRARSSPRRSRCRSASRSTCAATRTSVPFNDLDGARRSCSTSAATRSPA